MDRLPPLCSQGGGSVPEKTKGYYPRLCLNFYIRMDDLHIDPGRR